MAKRLVVIGLVGTTLDSLQGARRWKRWRPTVAVCSHESLPVARLEMLHSPASVGLAATIAADVKEVAPATEVVRREFAVRDPWDFEEVFTALHDFARSYPFDTEHEEYLVHITTGTHVVQICMFLLVESRHFPARLVQTSPGPLGAGSPQGVYSIIDLDLARYDGIAARFRRERATSLSVLKDGIATRSPIYNRMIEELEQVAVGGRDPILLLGPTGAGKSQLARRIYDLKRARHRLEGPLVEVNCATLRGDGAMSALFGHVRGAFTGAVAARAGCLRQADGGALFLDEIGELGTSEQALLLRALEDKRWPPVGADADVGSDFLLLAGTNRDLPSEVAAGRFRADLLARIDLWTFRLPGLAERREDLEPNLDHELERASTALGRRIVLAADARARFVAFATGPEGLWPGNFRDLAGAVRRMATLAHDGRVGRAEVDAELTRLRTAWRARHAPPASDDRHPTRDRHAAIDRVDPSIDRVDAVLGERAAAIDRFDRAQLAEVLAVCASAPTVSEAGRRLFAASRARRTSTNDADRLRKYLARWDLTWRDVAGSGGRDSQQLSE